MGGNEVFVKSNTSLNILVYLVVVSYSVNIKVCYKIVIVVFSQCWCNKPCIAINIMAKLYVLAQSCSLRCCTNDDDGDDDDDDDYDIYLKYVFLFCWPNM